MAHRKWREIKQQPSMLPGSAVPGCCLVSFHILWAILSTSTVQPIIRPVHFLMRLALLSSSSPFSSSPPLLGRNDKQNLDETVKGRKKSKRWRREGEVDEIDKLADRDGPCVWGRVMAARINILYPMFDRLSLMKELCSMLSHGTCPSGMNSLSQSSTELCYDIPSKFP